MEATGFCALIIALLSVINVAFSITSSNIDTLFLEVLVSTIGYAVLINEIVVFSMLLLIWQPLNLRTFLILLLAGVIVYLSFYAIESSSPMLTLLPLLPISVIVLIQFWCFQRVLGDTRTDFKNISARDGSSLPPTTDENRARLSIIDLLILTAEVSVILAILSIHDFKVIETRRNLLHSMPST